MLLIVAINLLLLVFLRRLFFLVLPQNLWVNLGALPRPRDFPGHKLRCPKDTNGMLCQCLNKCSLCHRLAVARVIPCRVASPQSQTPFRSEI